MAKLSIRLQCTQKSGTLARLIRSILLVGLRYESHHVDNMAGYSEILISASGTVNCSRAKLIETLEELPDVLNVQAIDVSGEGHIEAEELEDKTVVTEMMVGAEEPLTGEILSNAENKMTQIIGPIAKVLVESAAQSSRNAGELYSQLAEELDDEADKNDLLSSIRI